MRYLILALVLCSCASTSARLRSGLDAVEQVHGAVRKALLVMATRAGEECYAQSDAVEDYDDCMSAWGPIHLADLAVYDGFAALRSALSAGDSDAILIAAQRTLMALDDLHKVLTSSGIHVPDDVWRAIDLIRRLINAI